MIKFMTVASMLVLLIFLGCKDEDIQKRSKYIAPSAPYTSYALNPWKLHSSALTCSYLIVTYSEKYGPTKTVECMAVFESQTIYRLVGRDVNTLDLIKSNINSIEIRKKE